MATSQRTTKVKIENGVKFGQFANAFRIIDEVGPDCFLDFMIYSADLQEATVVARVRVRKEFLPNLCESLSRAMTEFGEGNKPPGVELTPSLRKNGETLH